MKSQADITLLLEGTYPFVRGGVSGWVHQIICGLPDLRFALVFLGANKKDYDAPKYELPKNVISLNCYFLLDPWPLEKPRRRKGHLQALADCKEIHHYFRHPEEELPTVLFKRICHRLIQGKGLEPEDFYYGMLSWNYITESYHKYCKDASFVDYFWTLRIIHGPIYKLAEVARRIDPTPVFHTISTGYAGFLGAILHNIAASPLILTEHGIYTKERTIDLQALYLQDQLGPFDQSSDSGLSYHHNIWIRFFQNLGRLTYSAADPIISLYERNRLRQIRDGAHPNRTLVIPNGIDLERFLPIRAKRPKIVPPILGLIGRIVPIKDIKTFIRSMHTVCAHLPEAEGWLIGPEEEDPAYVEECKNLVKSLGLEEKVKFLGFQNINNILPQLGLLILSSISEAFPLVIVEAYASGLPVVTTDVGGCREIIEGRDEEDRTLGQAGATVPMASPEALAHEALKLLTNPEQWHAAQISAIKRVEHYYTQQMVFDYYRNIYQRAIAR